MVSRRFGTLLATGLCLSLGLATSSASTNAPSTSEISATALTTTTATLLCSVDADQYTFRWRERGDLVWTTLPKSVKDTVNLSSLSPGTTHEFQCRLTCRFEDSLWSRTDTFDTLQITCPAPTLAQILLDPATHYQIGVDCSAQADEYTWRWRAQGDATWNESPPGSNSVRLYSTLEAGTVYEFSCRLTCGALQSDWSPARTAQTFPDPCPAPTANQITLDVATHFQIGADCTAAADEYFWRWREQGAAAWIEEPGNANSYFLISTLQGSTSYEFSCRLRCGTDESDWSPAKAAQTFPTPCPAPTSEQLIATVPTWKNIILRCTLPADEHSWRYRVQGTEDWTTFPFNDALDVILFFIPEEDTSFEYQCRVRCDGNPSPWSSIETFYMPAVPDPPRITDLTHSNGRLTVTWTSEPGQRFRIQTFSHAVGSSIVWTNDVLDWPAAPTGNTTSFIVPPKGTPSVLARVLLNFNGEE